jgi:hypothetical protein
MRIASRPAQWWADVLDVALGLWLVAPVKFRVEALRETTLAVYRYGPRLVVFNSRHLWRPPGAVLETLAHELTHAHFGDWVSDDIGHGPAFREKMASFGLRCDGDGVSEGMIEGRFTALLRAYGSRP